MDIVLRVAIATTLVFGMILPVYASQPTTKLYTPPLFMSVGSATCNAVNLRDTGPIDIKVEIYDEQGELQNDNEGSVEPRKGITTGAQSDQFNTFRCVVTYVGFKDEVRATLTVIFQTFSQDQPNNMVSSTVVAE